MSAEPQEATSRRRTLVIALVALVALGLLTVAAAARGGGEFSDTRSAIARYQHTEAAQADGWDLVPGLEACFDNQPTGAMGYHYINLEELEDPSVDPLRPEALVYAPQPNGKLKLAAVEWVVPGDGTEEPPMVQSHAMHYNTTLSVWAFHAWLFTNNPAGMFEDWNPKVTCPS